MQMHANVPGDRERESDTKQHRVRASPGKETKLWEKRGSGESRATVGKGL